MTAPFASWLDDSHRDQLKELVNIAMGDGAKALSSVTARYIQLSVPRLLRHWRRILFNSVNLPALKKFAAVCRNTVPSAKPVGC